MSQKGRTKFIQKQSIFPPEVHRLLIKSSLDSQWLPRETSKFLMTHDSSMHMFMFFSPFEDISNLNLAQKKDMKFVKRRGTCNLCHHFFGCIWSPPQHSHIPMTVGRRRTCQELKPRQLQEGCLQSNSPHPMFPQGVTNSKLQKRGETLQ